MDSTVTIPLSKGKTALIDTIDADLASQTWHSGHDYAVRNVWVHGECLTYRMHRIIVERILGRPLMTKEVVDHINGIRGDNRRSNLRCGSSQQNSRNQRKPKHNTSGYKGVVFLRGKWQAQIKHNGKNVYLGVYQNPTDAARAYDRGAIKLFEEFAKLNFPFELVKP